jgi:hypothetical protein
LRSPLSRACLVVCVAAIACSGPVSVDVAVGNTQPFVGKIWLSTDASAAPGTFRIFLPDGTLVMDSCVETYRLAKWRALDDRRVEWQEDTAKIEAEIAQPSPGELQLRLRLVGELSEQHYRLATIPFVCPDMPR